MLLNYANLCDKRAYVLAYKALSWPFNLHANHLVQRNSFDKQQGNVAFTLVICYIFFIFVSLIQK